MAVLELVRKQWFTEKSQFEKCEEVKCRTLALLYSPNIYIENFLSDQRQRPIFITEFLYTKDQIFHHRIPLFYKKWYISGWILCLIKTSHWFWWPEDIRYNSLSLINFNRIFYRCLQDKNLVLEVPLANIIIKFWDLIRARCGIIWSNLPCVRILSERNDSILKFLILH